MITPGFGQEFETDYLNFNASLLITKDLLKQIGKGHLVIEIQMNQIKEKDTNQDLFYTEPRYFLKINLPKNWEGAERHCKSLGGHLASAETNEEMQSIFKLAKNYPFWLGGKEVGGIWQWSNGEKMTMTNKTWLQPPPGVTDIHCSAVRYSKWYNKNCQKIIFPFICTVPMTLKITGNAAMVWSYTRGQIASVASIRFVYRYQASSKSKLNKEEKHRKPGFKIEWYVRSENGTKITIKEAENETQLWSAVKSAPYEQNERLQKMIRVAATKRALNMSKDYIIKEAAEKKVELLRSKGLNHLHCTGEVYYFLGLNDFDQVLVSEQPQKLSVSNVLKEDIETGLALYMIALHCPTETTKLAQFILQLADEESLPTFMLALINTLQSDQLTLFHKTLLGKIYKVLDGLIGGFYLGKILFATSSPAQLSAFNNLDLPYLNSSDHHVQKCPMGFPCDDIFGRIQGNLYSLAVPES